MIREREMKHPDMYLKTRPIKPFEKLMLQLGGKKILEKVTGKKLDKDMDEVYDW